MYIGDYLARRELYSPDKLAFIDAGKSPEWRLTFRDANRRANKLANWLKSQGVKKVTVSPSSPVTGTNISISSLPAPNLAPSTPRSTGVRIGGNCLRFSITPIPKF
jgi:hypothetical protein